MPSHLRIARFGSAPHPHRPTRAQLPHGAVAMPVHRSLIEPMARCYLACHGPADGGHDLLAARIRMTVIFDGAYGSLSTTWSSCLGDGEEVWGMALVTFGSVWDGGLDCPFLADLFVHPDHRGHGLGRALLSASMARVAGDGADLMALTLRPDTSAEALHLYEALGFVDPDERTEQ